MIFRIDVPVPPEGSVSDVGVKLVLRPDGEEVRLRLTVDEKPPTLLSVRVTEAEEPWVRAIEV